MSSKFQRNKNIAPHFFYCAEKWKNPIRDLFVAFFPTSKEEEIKKGFNFYSS